MAIDYVALLKTKTSAASMLSEVAKTKDLLIKYGAWINKYRGGIPAGWLGVIMLWESGGNFGAAGDAQLGEVGFFQIAKNIPGLFGLPAEARYDPESNVCIACLELDLEAIKLAQRYPQVQLGTKDSWMLAHLVFSIGRGGTYTLIDAAQPVRYGDVYGSVRDYVARTGGQQLGSQSPDKVWFRVLSLDVKWQIGRAADPFSIIGGPQIPPNPPTGTIVIPAGTQSYWSKPLGGTVLLLGAMAAGLGYLIHRQGR